MLPFPIIKVTKSTPGDSFLCHLINRALRRFTFMVRTAHRASKGSKRRVGARQLLLDDHAQELGLVVLFSGGFEML